MHLIKSIVFLFKYLSKELFPARNIIKLIFTFIFLYFHLSGNAQTGVIKGNILDTLESQNFSSFKIRLLSDSNSRLVDVAALSLNGFFEFRGIPVGNYSILVNIPDYKSITKSINIGPKNLVVDCGNIYLERFEKVLDTILIKSSLPSIVYKGDTTEYYTDSFKVPPNANVEELLKHLPGIYISRDGKIIVNGKEITQVLVNNEPFFNGDPTLATRNLPANIIDKIQIYNANSDAKNLTGIEDGQRTKTINIKIKKNRNRGSFGQVGIGGGVNDIYGLGGSLNNFKEKRQISFVLQSTNSNAPIFSSMIPNNTGSNGITRSTGIGLNFKNDFGTSTKINGSYLYNNQQITSIQKINTQNVFPMDSSTFQKLENRSARNNITNKFNLNILSKLNDNTSLTVRPTFNSNYTDQKNDQISNLNSEKKSSDTIYNSNNENRSLIKGKDIGSDFIFTHAFKKKFRSINLALNIRNTQINTSNYNISVNNFLIPYRRVDTLNQLQKILNSNNSILSELTYSEPLGINQALSVTYIYHNEIKQNELNVFKYNSLNDDYNIVDSFQSNQSKSILNNNNLQLKYQLINNKYSLIISDGIEIQNFKLDNYITKNKSTSNYITQIPKIDFEYHFNSNNLLQFNYSLATQQPDLTQLQNVITTSDSLSIYKGNPELKQMQMHNFLMNYTKNNPQNQTTLSAVISGMFIKNDIQYATTILPNGVQITMPTNVNGSYNVTGSVDYNFPIRAMRSSFQLNSTLNYNNNKAILNNQDINTKNYNITERIGISTNSSKHLFLNIYSNTTYNFISYIATSLIKTSFLEERISGNIKYFPISKFYLSGNIDITYNSSMSNYNQRKVVPIISPSIGTFLFKNDLVEAKLAFYDILNRSAFITTRIYQNTIQNSQVNSRGRNVMLSLIYNFRKFPKTN